MEPGSQEALKAGNIYNEKQIFASVFYEDYSANIASDVNDAVDESMLGESQLNKNVRYGVWSAKTQLTAGPGSYSNVSAAVMADGRVLLAANKCQLTLSDSSESAVLTSDPNTFQLVAMTLIPAVRVEMPENSVTFDTSYPTAGEPVQIYASFRNLGLMPLIKPAMEFFAVRDGVETSIGTAEVTNPVYGGGTGLASIEWTVPDDVKGLKIEARLTASGGSLLAKSETAFPWGAELAYNTLHLIYVAKNCYQAYLEAINEGNQPLTGAELVISQVASGSVLRELNRVPLEDEAAGKLFSKSVSFEISNDSLEQLSGVLGGSASIRVSIEKNGVTLLSHTGTVKKDLSGIYGEWLSSASGVELPVSSLAMILGSKNSISSSVSPAEAGDKFKIVYTSSDPSVASVSESGEITALRIGTAVITAYAVPNIEVHSFSIDGYSTEGDILDNLALEDCPSNSLPVTVYGGDSSPGNVTLPSDTEVKAVKAVINGTGTASASVSEQQAGAAVKAALGQTSGSKYASVVVDAPETVGAVETTFSSAAIRQIHDNKLGLSLSTPVAAVAFDAAALGNISGTAAGAVTFTASRVDTSSLPDKVKHTVGSRPVYEFTVKSGDSIISKFDGSVAVSIPYKLAAGENPNAVIVNYINASGNLETITNGRYDAKTGSVLFSTNHFSQYAISYNKVAFNDVADTDWYADAVTFLAARRITTGTTEITFSPDATLTRGQFITLLLRAYDIPAEENSEDNFSDAGSAYYTGYLAAAKRLNISKGVGDNKFAPEQTITRQEMFTLLYNALMSVGQLPQANSGKTLADFIDAGQISSWAKDAMTLFVKAGIVSGNAGKLTPLNTATRAEMAQVLYNFLGE